MRPSFIVAVVIASAVGISMTPILQSPVLAQGMPPGGGQGAQPGAQPSIKEAAGQLKTDTGKTKDDVKAMDVNKGKQDAGQVNKDVQGLKESIKDMPTNPMGK